MKYGALVLALALASCATAEYATLPPAGKVELDCASIAVESARAAGFRDQAEAGRKLLPSGARRQAVRSAEARLAVLSQAATAQRCPAGI